MKQFIIAPDSFKGTMQANEVIDLISQAIRTHIPDAIIHGIPLSDGGEGLVECYAKLRPLTLVHPIVHNMFDEPVEATYGLISPTEAVMEMSSCAGLPAAKGRENPLVATTYGVGEMIQHAVHQGVSHIILGIGGSATNDCGIGMAYALGYRFEDANGTEVAPYAKHMQDIAHILPPASLPDVRISVACDVDNPLYGPKGAAYIFGPQKGADPAMVEFLDRGLVNMADVIKRDCGIDVDTIPGAGAAGGLGAGLVAFLGASLRPGIDMLLDVAGYDALLANADIVFTGEGRIDGQSIHGKVPIGVSRRAKAAGVPCIALCGAIGKDADAVYEHGITSMFSAVQGATTMEKIEQTCRQDMLCLADAVMRILLLR